MIRNLVILGGIVGSIAAYTWFDGKNTAPRVTIEPLTTTQQNERQAAPDFSFKTMDGTSHRLKDFQGKPVLLNFWASWCAPCVIEFPAMLELAQKTDGIFIFLSQDDGDAEIERFIRRYGKGLPIKNVFIARDEKKETAQKLYQTFKLPETYIIDKNTRITEKVIGADIDWASAEMQEKINDLSAE